MEKTASRRVGVAPGCRWVACTVAVFVAVVTSPAQLLVGPTKAASITPANGATNVDRTQGATPGQALEFAAQAGSEMKHLSGSKSKHFHILKFI